jgi:hypothetical protein
MNKKIFPAIRIRLFFADKNAFQEILRLLRNAWNLAFPRPNFRKKALSWQEEKAEKGVEE